MNIEHLIDILKQKIKGNLFDDRDEFIYYRSYESDVDELPRVVKFSGGRTSGYMLVSLLANGHLKPERGGCRLIQQHSG